MRLAIKGPPGCGKTALISTLEAAGYVCELKETLDTRDGELVEVWHVEPPVWVAAEALGVANG